MPSSTSLYWHDYETFGANPKFDRPAQFAGIRTDQNLNVIGDPLMLYCKPADDFLPHPEACLITGITPQICLEKGLPETQFMGQILKELAQPGTCGIGYNSLRFDDEITRYSLYRNLYDPYAREWQNGNSRWDIIDMARLAQALRPEGIQWPRNDQGHPVFKLEALTQANGIEHQGAHDALVDVRATIALARLIKTAQPKLYDYIFGMRKKPQIGQLLNPVQMNPVLHVSSKYPAKSNCIALVAPIGRHPTNKNGVVVFDLSTDPEQLWELSAGEIRERVFTASDQLLEGTDRIAIKTIHLNRAPVVVPLNTMRNEDQQRLGIDTDLCMKNLDWIKRQTSISAKLASVFSEDNFAEEFDPDFLLYGGGFFSDSDRAMMQKIHHLNPDQLTEHSTLADDRRFPEMLFRYRARNYPKSLSSEEQKIWIDFRRERLLGNTYSQLLNFESFRDRIVALKSEHQTSQSNMQILSALEDYAQTLEASLED